MSLLSPPMPSQTSDAHCGFRALSQVPVAVPWPPKSQRRTVGGSDACFGRVGGVEEDLVVEVGSLDEGLRGVRCQGYYLAGLVGRGAGVAELVGEGEGCFA